LFKNGYKPEDKDWEFLKENIEELLDINNLDLVKLLK
jgi:hypothetical protein